MSLPLQTRRLTKRYGRRVVLDALELELGPGEVLGFLGPNGAGKTTTIRLALGLARPSAGSVAVFGRPPGSAEAHARLAYVPGEAGLWPTLTGRETLDMLGALHGTVDLAYRTALVERFDVELDRRVRELSKGNRQKLCLVAALMTRAELLLLDEPTSGLDPVMEAEFRACLREARERGQAALLSSHVLGEVEAVCDRVAILRGGRLVREGTLEELRALVTPHIEATLPAGHRPLVLPAGAAAAEIGADRVRLRPGDDLPGVLRALADAGATALVSRPPTLEEIFLDDYRVADAARA